VIFYVSLRVLLTRLVYCSIRRKFFFKYKGKQYQLVHTGIYSSLTTEVRAVENLAPTHALFTLKFKYSTKHQIKRIIHLRYKHNDVT
jgi:hypothetical protein